MKFVEPLNLVAIIFLSCQSKFSKFDILIFLVSFPCLALWLYVTDVKLQAIKVLGFKPAEAIEWQFNVNTSYFLYPSEENYTGSTRAFTALVRSLWNKGKVAVVSAILRSNSSPRMCVLFPALDPISSDGLPTCQGLYLISLPFVDDLREAPGYSVCRGWYSQYYLTFF